MELHDRSSNVALDSFNAVRLAAELYATLLTSAYFTHFSSFFTLADSLHPHGQSFHILAMSSLSLYLSIKSIALSLDRRKRAGYAVSLVQLTQKQLSVNNIHSMLRPIAAEEMPHDKTEWAKLATLPADVQELLQQQSESTVRAGNSVLLTGATGFLGVHLIAKFVSLGVGKIFCLVRDDSDAVARRRLEAQVERMLLLGLTRIDSATHKCGRFSGAHR